MPTRLCDSTSRAFSEIDTRSMRFLCAARHSTAHSTRSSFSKTSMRPLDVSPVACPARPMRCRPLATDLGEPICTTRSTEPMSMPSSSDVDDTTHLSSPRFNRSSTSRRVSLAREPWWASMLSIPRSLSLNTTASVPERVLVNTMVVRCSMIISYSWSYIFEFTISKGREVMSSVGHSTLTSRSRWRTISTTFTSRGCPSS